MRLRLRLRRTIRITEIIGLSVNASTENERLMLKAGASMLLSKETAVDELYKAIRSAVELQKSRSDRTRKRDQRLKVDGEQLSEMESRIVPHSFNSPVTPLYK